MGAALHNASPEEQSRVLLAELASLIRHGYRQSGDDPQSTIRAWWSTHSPSLLPEHVAVARESLAALGHGV